jgi:hypothetical protein
MKSCWGGVVIQSGHLVYEQGANVSNAEPTMRFCWHNEAFLPHVLLTAAQWYSGVCWLMSDCGLHCQAGADTSAHAPPLMTAGGTPPPFPQLWLQLESRRRRPMQRFELRWHTACLTHEARYVPYTSYKGLLCIIAASTCMLPLIGRYVGCMCSFCTKMAASIAIHLCMVWVAGSLWESRASSSFLKHPRPPLHHQNPVLVWCAIYLTLCAVVDCTLLPPIS